jgi:hypothetical protein
MKEVFSLAVFAGKVLCLMVFVAGLKPDSIGAVQKSAKPYCKNRAFGTAGIGVERKISLQGVPRQSKCLDRFRATTRRKPAMDEASPSAPVAA